MSEENQNVEGTEEELVDNEILDELSANEEESGEESEVEDGEDVSADDDGGDSEEEAEGNSRGAREKRRDSQIDRLKEENRKLKAEAKESGSEKEGIVTNSELVERTFLAANGIKDREVQDEVIRLAHKFDIPVDEAMDDSDIKVRAEALIKKKAASRSVAKSTGGAAARTKGVAYHTAYFEKHGDFAPGATNEMISKVTDVLAKK